ncbi:MAG: glycoside hydrolase family 88 protein [Chitinophagaceae bacterium]|nr:glycoside hydrolase family 88 protein [Chitinophagaceae bacterium]
MKHRILLLIVGLTSNFVYGQPMRKLVEDDLVFAEGQYKTLMQKLPPGQMPRTYDKTADTLVTSGSDWWCSGFYPGSLWYLYEYSHDPAFKQEAEQRMEIIEQEKNDRSDHDLGFKLMCSYGNAYRITGDPVYKKVLLDAVQSLISRFRPSIRSIQSWDSSSRYRCPVIIDNLMNLELLEWGDPYDTMAIQHANTAMRNHFRKDYSTWHVVDYDLHTGEPSRKITRQGAADGSTWSRGEAWALYAYTMLYRYTRDHSYLSQAEHVAHFILSHPRLPADGVPYWDFDAPGIPNTYRDASAAAIMASALLELGLYTKAVNSARYVSAAEKMLRSLSSPAYRAAPGTNGGFLLTHSVGALPFGSEVDKPLTYADYYFLEALLRYRNWWLDSVRSSPSSPEPRYLTDTMKFYDGRSLTVTGQFHNENNYHRLPQKYKGVVRDPVWGESLSAAGISIRFRTNAATLRLRWKLAEYIKSWNLNSAGGDGLDLYAHTEKGWQYVNTALAKDTINEFTLLRNSEPVYREYLLNLPLYNCVTSLSIGVNQWAVMSEPSERYLLDKKPVVYYGSSIAQGASASRPGLAYTNLMSRRLDRSFINLGFSGEGTFDESVGQAMSEIDAALYAIDCTPNSKKEIIYDRTVALVRQLKSRRPATPVLLIEGYYYDDVAFEKDRNSNIDAKRKELRRAYDTLIRAGIKGLYYKTGDGLTGHDHEGTVDGVHPNDIGMLRFADQMQPVISSILTKHPSNTSVNEYYTLDDFASVKKIDAHVHLTDEVDTAFVRQAEMDNFRLLNINVYATNGTPLEEQQDFALREIRAFPGRLAYATAFSLKHFNDTGWQREVIAGLERSFSLGAVAVKVWKNVGMELRDTSGNLVLIDDPRFDTVLDFIAKKGITLIGHLGEHRNSWLPLDKMTVKGNRDYAAAHPQEYMYLHPERPSYATYIRARDHMLEKHPDLTFVGAHLGSLEWSVDELAKRLDKYPNMAVDLAERISHLQYQALTQWQKVHDFFIKYQDRLIYGTDMRNEAMDVVNEHITGYEGLKKHAHEVWLRHWRFFTTGGAMSVPKVQGVFNGMRLPRQVVDKIYFNNALKWYPGLSGKIN